MDSHRTAAALANLARALTDGGNLASAEGYLQQALDLSKSGDSSPSVETADILVQYAQFELNAKSDPPRATKLFTEALGIYRSALGNQNLSVAVTLSGLASAALWTNDYASAERYERQAIEIFQATVSRNYPDHAVALATLGHVLTERGEYREAEQVLTESFQIERAVFGENSDLLAQTDSNFSILYDRQGDDVRAIKAMRDAIAIESKRPRFRPLLDRLLS